MRSKGYVLLTIGLLIATLFMVRCGGGSDNITVTAKIVLQDGTEKELASTPIPLFLKLTLTFSQAVVPANVEPLFSLKNGDKTVPVTFSWNSDNTVATVRPKDLLDYETTYTVSVTAGAAASVSKANVTATTGTFTTMVEGDVNGDGKADPVLTANDWNAGGKMGRGYLFYWSGLQAAMPAQNSSAKVSGEAAGQNFGIAGTTDFDQDGYADLHGSANPDADDMGRAYLFYGAAGDAPISGDLAASSAANIFSGVEVSESFQLVTSNDVNGDGYADIIAKGRCNTDVGCVYIFLGPDLAAQESSDTADITIRGANAGDWFAAPWLSNGVRAADVNSDGIADILASSPGAAGGNGLLHVFYGGTGLASKSASASDVTITGEGASNEFADIFLCDLDGDGRQDIIATDGGYDGSRGRVYVFYNSNIATKNAADADVIFTGETVGDGFESVQTGDVNGDGTEDLLVGARVYDSNHGRTYIFFGGTGFVTKGAADASVIYTGNINDDLRVGRPADVNGDGIKDVLMHKASSAGEQGKIYLFFGGSGLASAAVTGANVILSGEVTPDLYDLLDTRDVNGDGIADVIASAYGYDSFRGRAYIFYGDSAIGSKTADNANIVITGENIKDNFGIY